MGCSDFVRRRGRNPCGARAHRERGRGDPAARGDNHDKAANEAHQYDHTRRFNCRNPAAPLIYVHTPDFDLFCCGHAQLPDGRILIAGGTDEFPDDAPGIHQHLHFAGHRHVAIYDPTIRTLTPAADMNPAPGQGGAGGGRWYPTLCTLASGEVFTFEGHPRGDDSRHDNNTPERYQPLADGWVLLPAVGVAGGAPTLYPRLHLLRDGKLFVSSAIPGHGQNITVDPYGGGVQEVSPLPDGAYAGFDCPSVLLPLVAPDGYQPRVLLAGGGVSQMIDLGAGSPNWVTVPRTGSAANVKRTHACATLLPTGDVLLTGGTSDANDQTGVSTPEIYRTPYDRASRTYTGGVGQWQTINEPATVLRNYHSTALLMPDGRVWTAGGNSPNQPGQPPTATQKQIEIYTPPYPAGARPHIDACPAIIVHGDTFTVGTAQAAQIQSVVLIRCGTSTHAFNPDQRMIVLESQHAGASTLNLTAPPSGFVAPPGSYMLFIVDNGGRPCDYARFVRVGGHLSMFNSRSDFSQHEIEALLSGATPGIISDALYVTLDGFAAADLSGTPDRPFPPTLAFNFADTNAGVPDLDALLLNVLYEAPAAAADVVQRITLAYGLRWASTHAFDGIAVGAERAITVEVAWGPSRTSGAIRVFTHEHVYALKGPTPWLSIDTRVVRVPRGQFIAGLQNNGAVAFVGALIDRFRSLPNDEFHPFRSLTPDEAASWLELSPSVAGTEVNNFAVAKVRFRAPTGIDATDVKVFFRLFTTSVTNLVYDTGTTYPRMGNGAGAVPLQGMVGGEVASIPFFADPANHTDPHNVTTLHGAGATEIVTYFGCWLNFNQDAGLRNLLRGRHQCLVAEIHYVPSPIAAGATPSNNDQLSQRNLAIQESDNPGGPAAHTVAHTFELKPSLVPLPVGPALAVAEPSGAFAAREGLPDELFIRWNGLPRDSVATLYLPGAAAADLVAFAALRAGAGSMTGSDDHTLQLRVADATYVPLPGDRATNLPGLLTVTLPPSVREGRNYTVDLHQVSGRFRRSIIGSFKVLIPVSRAALLVNEAARELGVLRAIGRTVLPGNRWEPVFTRYLGILSDRLGALGGDPSSVPEPGEDGDGRPPSKDHRLTGKVVEILYSCFGDFEGFVLETCEARYVLHGEEKLLHDRVHEASVARLTVTAELAHSRSSRVRRLWVHHH
jgi:hypothetical protein